MLHSIMRFCSRQLTNTAAKSTNAKACFVSAAVILLSLTIAVCINRQMFSADVAAAKSGDAGQSGGRAERVLAASYYNVKDGWRSALMLSNQGPTTMPVEITLYSLSGEQFNLPPVAFNANEVKTFNLREYIPATGFEEGSLQVLYQGKSLELGGVVQLIDESRSLIFDEELSNPKSFASSRLEGVWWRPRRDAKINMILSNTTSQGVTAIVRVQGASPRQAPPKDIFLGPHETRILEIADLIGKETMNLSHLIEKEIVNLSKSGGISITHDGPSGGVLARGLVRKSSIGYSNVIEFSDPSKSKTTQLDGVGLRVGKVAGKRLIQGVVARNVGESKIKVDGRISFVDQNGSGEITLPELWLEPGEIREVAVAEALKDNDMRRIQVSGLHFEHTGNPGDVVVSATSMSVDGTHVFRAPFRDASLSSSVGIYPWNLEGESSAVVYLQNVSDTPHEYTLQIVFDGGAYVLGVKNLEARQVIAYDIRELRDLQIPDAVGRTIPQKITSGKVHWSIRGTADRSLIARIEQLDSVKGLSMTSACGACCPNSFDSIYMSPGAVAGFPGDTTQFTLTLQEVNCFGTLLPPTPVSGGFWSSSNTSVAIVNSSGFATAVGPGSALIQNFSTGTVYTNCCGECGNDEYCCDGETVEAICEASCDVQPPPTITRLEPDRGLIGQSHSVTVVGDGFEDPAGVNVAGSGITANVRSVGPRSIVVDFVVAADAGLGNHAVTVTVSGQTSNSVNFFVQEPKSLRRDQITEVIDIDPGPGDIKDIFDQVVVQNACGAYRNLKYTVLDQDNPGQPINFENGVGIMEQLSGYNGPPELQSALIPFNNVTTNVGEIGDVVGISGPHPTCPPPFMLSFTQKFKATVGNKEWTLTTVNSISMEKKADGTYTITVTNTTP
jgi:IPT/TIG domain